MIFLIIFFGCCFLLILYMLFVPVILCIDTTTNEYYLQLSGLGKASLKPDKEAMVYIHLNILFFNLRFYPLKKRKVSGKRKTTEKNDRKMRMKGINIRKGLRILRTFKVKRFLLDVDTGDCISNAKLYPLFSLLNYRVGNFNVNFNDRNALILVIQNRPIFIILSLIKN